MFRLDRQIAGLERRAVAGQQLVGGAFGKQVLQPPADGGLARNSEQAFRGLVEQDEAFLRKLLHGDHHRHILDDGVKKRLGAADLGRRGFALVRVPELQNGHDEADRRQGAEQAERQANALHQDGVQERRRRHVDDEGAHDVVEAPSDVGLQRVVTIDAALFMRHRGIERAEHRLAVDGHELRIGLGVGRRGEGVDGRRHLSVGRRRLDRHPLATNPE